MLRLITLLSIILSSSIVSANTNDEINEWYISKNGSYVIRDSISDAYLAVLSENQRGELNIYIQYWDGDKCNEDGDALRKHDPLYVNNKLVKYLQACHGGWRTFFPDTDAGRKYILSEFKNKNIVEISTYNRDFKLLFSAKGFTKLFNKKLIKKDLELEAI